MRVFYGARKDRLWMMKVLFMPCFRWDAVGTLMGMFENFGIVIDVFVSRLDAQLERHRSDHVKEDMAVQHLHHGAKSLLMARQ